MPTVPPQLDLEKPTEEAEAPADAPLSFVPHDVNAAPVAPVRIRTNRFGELEEHELIKLLDTIEDERARGRFRESIYISVFVWLAIAWVVFYGPRYLWHSPQLISPVEVMKQHALLELNAPVLHHPVVPPPKVDVKTLEHLRSTERKFTPTAPRETPTPAPVTSPTPPQPTASTADSLPLPSAPTPTVSRNSTAPIADAPTPQPAAKPNFDTPGTASDDMRNAVRDAARNRNTGSGERSGGVRLPGGASGGGGSQILTDTQGVDFSQWSRHFDSDVMRNWAPLLPEETEAPLFKKGHTYLIVKIMKDGSIGDLRLENSSRDVAIDHAAWNSITSEGKFEGLPRAFSGPFIILRLTYTVNEDPR